MTPTFTLTGESCEIKSHGWLVYTARLTCCCSRDDLSKLVGTSIFDGLKEKKIVAVESFAIEQQDHRWIGLAVEK
jgi:hypothetical protein